MSDIRTDSKRAAPAGSGHEMHADPPRSEEPSQFEGVNRVSSEHPRIYVKGEEQNIHVPGWQRNRSNERRTVRDNCIAVVLVFRNTWL